MISKNNNLYFRRGVILAGVSALLISCAEVKPKPEMASTQSIPPTPIPWSRATLPFAADAALEQRVANLVARMTLEEKVGQMTQPEISFITPDDVRRFHIGSVLNGGDAKPYSNLHSQAQDWLSLADAYYQASVDTRGGAIGIPVIWGTDAVHGHNNLLGATIFPHNIGLGAANNPKLMQAIGAATAKEVAVTGLDWTFAPTVAVVRNDRWGRTYEGYSEDPEIVSRLTGPFIQGLQSGGQIKNGFILATAKHFIGDGGTDTGKDQGVNLSTEAELQRLHAPGYYAALSAGVQTIMASYSSALGSKMHGNHYLLTDVLRQQMGFDGFVIGDYNGHAQVEGCNKQQCAAAINAGVDMIMVPTAWRAFIKNTLADVHSGRISQSRIDEAVTRILRVKARAGILDQGRPASRPLANHTELVGSQSHRNLARQAVRESLVLLKNDKQLLPLAPKQKILVVGNAADDIAKQCGGWSLSWQANRLNNTDFPGATSIYAGIAKAVGDAGGQVVLDVKGTGYIKGKGAIKGDMNNAFSGRPDAVIAVFGESPYAETKGDRRTLEYQSHDLAMLKRFKEQGIPVISVLVSGRPLVATSEIAASDAFIAAWLPGSEGAGIADVLFQGQNQGKQFPVTGRLSFSWPASVEQSLVNRGDAVPALFPYGYGLSY